MCGDGETLAAWGIQDCPGAAASDQFSGSGALLAASAYGNRYWRIAGDAISEVARPGMESFDHTYYSF